MIFIYKYLNPIDLRFVNIRDTFDILCYILPMDSQSVTVFNILLFIIILPKKLAFSRKKEGKIFANVGKIL